MLVMRTVNAFDDMETWLSKINNADFRTEIAFESMKVKSLLAGAAPIC